MKIKEIKETIKMIEDMHGVKFYWYQKVLIGYLMFQGAIISKWYNRHVRLVNKSITMKGRRFI